MNLPTPARGTFIALVALFPLVGSHLQSQEEAAPSPVVETAAPPAPVVGPVVGPVIEPEPVGELDTVVVESAPVVINDRVPTPVRVESSVALFDTIVVPGKDQSLLGIAGAASMGRASADELMDRPYLRRGELLEVVPGMIITQHSGGGNEGVFDQHRGFLSKG
jgi:hypothetical protein